MYRNVVSSILIATGVMLASTVILSGCSTDRTMGVVENGPSNPDLRFAAEGAATLGVAALSSSTVSVVERPLSKVIDGAAGGTVSNGRYTVTFPAGAFKGVQTITVSEATDLYLECHLYPEGLTFDKPVTLEINLLNTTGDKADATVYWYDPAGQNWVDIGGNYLATSHVIKASLAHFSEYRPGRAGW